MVFRSLWLNQDQTQPDAKSRPQTGPADSTKKADVVENPKVPGHIGLLVNEPPG
jgi:hypothetical protein